MAAEFAGEIGTGRDGGHGMSLAANEEFHDGDTEARRKKIAHRSAQSVLRNFCRQQGPELLKTCGAGEYAFRKDSNEIGGLVKQKRPGGFIKLEIGAPGRFRTPQLMVGNDSGLILRDVELRELNTLRRSEKKEIIQK